MRSCRQLLAKLSAQSGLHLSRISYGEMTQLQKEMKGMLWLHNDIHKWILFLMIFMESDYITPLSCCHNYFALLEGRGIFVQCFGGAWHFWRRCFHCFGGMLARCVAGGGVAFGVLAVFWRDSVFLDGCLGVGHDRRGLMHLSVKVRSVMCKYFLC